jgi:hypothetical protein
MSLSNMIGSLGVALLLLAFFLSLFKFIGQDNKGYIILNITGAGLSCYASLLIHFLPFVILEGIWCLVALIALIKKRTAS